MGLMSWLRGGRGADRSGDAPALAPAPVPVADRGERVDLNRLEPLQRVVSGQRLTVGPAEFEASLTTRQDTALGTPLGHLVSPDAPAGLVHGVGVAESAPVPSSVAAQRSVDMPVRGAVTHFGRVGGPEAVPGVVSAPVSVPPPVPVQRLYGGEHSAMTSSAGAESGPGGGEELPVRRLVGERSVVAEPAPPVPPSDPSSDLSPAPASGGVGVQRASVPPAGDRPRRAPGLGAPLPGLPPTAQRRAASSPEAAGSQVPPAAPAAPGPSEAVLPGGADQPTAPLLGDDPLVGEVLPSRPDDLGVEAPAAASVSDVGGAGEAGLVGGAAGAEEVGGAGGAGISLQRSAGPPAPFGPSSAPPAPPAPPAPADSGPIAPLLGDRPLVPRNVDVQRAAAPVSGPAAGPASEPGGSSAPPPEGVPVRWIGAEGGGQVAGPGVSVGSAPPLSAPAGPPSAFLQRRAAGEPPVPASVARSLPGSGSGRRLPSAGSVAVAAGVAQRMADGSVVFGGAPISGTSRPVVQRDSEVAESVEEPPPPEPHPVTEPESGVEAGPGPVTESGGGAGAAPKDGKGAPAVTDELVRALYAPLSRLLKNDLRLERERAGHLINTRH